MDWEVCKSWYGYKLESWRTNQYSKDSLLKYQVPWDVTTVLAPGESCCYLFGVRSTNTDSTNSLMMRASLIALDGERILPDNNMNVSRTYDTYKTSNGIANMQNYQSSSYRSKIESWVVVEAVENTAEQYVQSGVVSVN